MLVKAGKGRIFAGMHPAAYAHMILGFKHCASGRSTHLFLDWCDCLKSISALATFVTHNMLCSPACISHAVTALQRPAFFSCRPGMQQAREVHKSHHEDLATAACMSIQYAICMYCCTRCSRMPSVPVSFGAPEIADRKARTPAQVCERLLNGSNS